MKAKTKKIGEILLENRLITENVLSEALEYQAKTGVGITQYLIAHGYISEEELAKCITEQFRLPYLPISAYDISPEMIKLLPAEVAIKYCLMPIDRLENIVTVVMANPLNTDAIEEIEEITGCVVQPFVGILPDIIKAIEEYYHIVIQNKKLKKGKTAALFSKAKSYKGAERRKSVRLKAEIDIHFPLQKAYKKSKIKDLSMNGFLFESDSVLPVDTYVTLQIDLPKDFSSSPIAAVVQVVRVVPLMNDKFDIGARLVRMPKEDTRTVFAYARKHKRQPCNFS